MKSDLPLHEQFEDTCREVEYLKTKLATADYLNDFYRKSFLIYKNFFDYCQVMHEKEPLEFRDFCMKTIAAIDGIFSKVSPGCHDFNFDAFDEPRDFLKSFRAYLQKKKQFWSQGRPIT